MHGMADVWYASHNGSSSNCSGLSTEQQQSLSILKGALSVFSCLPCAVVVVMIICLKAYRSFIYRLATYLTLAAIFYSITTALQMVPGDLFHVYNRAFCKAVGFLAEYGSWVLLLYIYWVIVQLLLLSVCHVSTKKVEVILVFFPILLPLCFVWVPFVHDLYGPAGGWCWIMTATAECQTIREGQIEQFVLWYGPMFVASLGSIVVTLTTIIMLCRGARAGEGDENPMQFQYQRALKEAIPLLIYSILFSLFDWVAISSRVYYAVTDQTNYPLWLVHAIGDASRGLFVPFAFLFHPDLLKKLNYKKFKVTACRWFHRHSAYSSTFFVVSKEHTDQSERLVIRGRGDPRAAPDTGYQSGQDGWLDA